MAPIVSEDQTALEEQLKDVIQDLYQVMVQASTYDAMGRPSRDVLAAGVRTVSESLLRVGATAGARPGAQVPPELVQYVENGRNPDIYTREFVEIVRRSNQLMCGKVRGFQALRDVLASQIRTAMPELRDDVDSVLADAAADSLVDTS